MIKALTAVVICLTATQAFAGTGDALGWVRQTLAKEADSGRACGRKEGSIRSTLARLERLSIPPTGKVLIVNIPSGSVTAYQDGEAVIESRAVVGGDAQATRTPEMDTRVTFVRPNPTWTVPESILRRKKWRERLTVDPEYFERNGFDVVVNGRAVSPLEVADDAAGVSHFVQRPFKNNALGQVKIGIENSQAIYLHDTNEPGLFDEEVRLASSGCVRVERIREIAAWILGVDTSSIDDLIEDDDTVNHVPPRTVRVIIGYWTAWPDADGEIQYYPDVYRKDEIGDACRGVTTSDSITNANPRFTWTQNEAR